MHSDRATLPGFGVYRLSNFFILSAGVAIRRPAGEGHVRQGILQKSMRNNGAVRGFLIRISENFAKHSWLHFVSALCIGIWAFYFFSIGGGVLGGIGLGTLVFIFGYICIAALPATLIDVINRPWALIVPIVLFIVLLVIGKNI